MAPEMGEGLPGPTIIFLPDVTAGFLTPRKCWSKCILAAGLALVDESVLFRRDATSGRHRLYFALSEALASPVFGTLLVEGEYQDSWLLSGLRQ